MSDELLTVEQTAEKLQMHVATVRRMLRNGQLPGVKLGAKEWRVPSQALREHLEKGMRKPAASEGPAPDSEGHRSGTHGD